jgi:uncharacterized protein with HEPN domain
MQNSDRDTAALWDMLRAIQHIQEFTGELAETDYLGSFLVQRAVEQELESLGEAAPSKMKDDN